MQTKLQVDSLANYLIGSGGFVEDLSFFGGNIGFVAGSQQFTARNLQFTSCGTAIKHIWNWSFTWKNISVYSCYIAIDCTKVGGANPDGGPPQGTGSITVLGLFASLICISHIRPLTEDRFSL